jgi:hypothetical protein
MNNKIRTNINYGSRIQALLERDVEYYSFESRDAAAVFLDDRLDHDDENIVYVYFFSSIGDEFLNAKITRHTQELILYLIYIDFLEVDAITLNVFEFGAYKDALDYLNDYFETSSLY